MSGHTDEELGASVGHVFDQFVNSCTCKSILSSFDQLLDLTGLRHADHTQFYQCLKVKLKSSWKAQNLWTKLDKRAAHRDYKKGHACKDIKVLVIGAGPCGLRSAIECALMGAKTVLVEKRDRFSRNNVLHLWPYLITDLRNLGAKKFFGKFCAGAIDHISIRQLQCILLKVALLLGVEIHVNVTFEGLLEPPEDQTTNIGWRCKVTPENHALSEYQFDVLIGADGKRNTLPGFSRKEFRGKLAIAVTANFINRNTQAEARVEEISGVAFIFNQKFFHELKESTRIDLENIVYYKDDTHYFVMTAKKASLLEKGVLKEDYADTITLLDRANVNQEALMEYAREAADFSTNYQLPSLDYAVNHYGQADVAMFDFTSMFAAENASRFIVKNDHHLLMALVGDSLLEPFWPTGSGCARGFLGAFDAAWMIRSWASGKYSPLQVLAERESVYTVLSQTTPNYLHKNHSQYSIDPNTRYPNLNLKCVKPNQVVHLYEGGDLKETEQEETLNIPTKKARNECSIDSYSLLRWCQRVLNTGKYRDVHVVNLTSSWRSGLALCSLIHTFRPDIIDVSTLMESEVIQNNNLAFSVADKQLGIPPVMTGEEMSKCEVPDKLTMVAYLSQFYQLFKQDTLPLLMPLPNVKSKRKSLGKDSHPKSPRSPNRRVSLLQKLSARLAKSKKRKELEENEHKSPLSSKKFKERIQKPEVELMRYNKLPMEEIANKLQVDRPSTDPKSGKAKTTEEMMGAVSVTAMADLLVAKFKDLEDKPVPEPVKKFKTAAPVLLAASSNSEFCSFCHKRVYIMERMSAQGEFFHRHCFKCDHCGVGLRLSNYSCDKDIKPVKFYCYRHALPEMRLRPARKRSIQDTKENIPISVVTTVDDTNQASKEKSPRKTAPEHLSQLSLPGQVLEKPGKTPERVEFEISFDGEEESEEEQFEHNLRASMSSDTLLDNPEDDDSLSDSDSTSDIDELDYLSDSEMARILDEWSGAEDEIWESTVESPQTPDGPMTSEEARRLLGSLREQLANSYRERERQRSERGYERLWRQEDEDESSTEVEDSEYETGESSAGGDQNEESVEDKTEPSKSTDSSKTCTSPLARISASKASFFSEPPKVVSIDPWSMFGMNNKATEKVEQDISSKRESNVIGEEEVKNEIEGKDSYVEELKIADIQEKTKIEVLKEDRVSDLVKEGSELQNEIEIENQKLLKTEFDYLFDEDNTDPMEVESSIVEKESESEDRVEDKLEEFERAFIEDEENSQRTRHSTGDSLDDLQNELSPALNTEFVTFKSKLVSPEERVGDFLQYAEPLKWDTDDEEQELNSELVDSRQYSSDISGQNVNINQQESKNNIPNKTFIKASSKQMEQLLEDFKKPSFPKTKIPAPLQGDTTSDSADNEVFVEGRLSPSASKTRKFHMKRKARRSQNRKPLSNRGRLNSSESDAARTDPTTTDNSLPRSSVSRSPSAELERLMSFSKSATSDDATTPDDIKELQKDLEGDRSFQQTQSNSPHFLDSIKSENILDLEKSKSLKNSEKLNEKIAVHSDIADIGDLSKILESTLSKSSKFKTKVPEEPVSAARKSVMAKLSAQKANFFAEPPRVVSLTPDIELKENIPAKSGSPEETEPTLEKDTMNETTDDALRQLLESVAKMPDVSDNSDIDDLVFANVDDRFVTDRKRGKRKNVKLKPKKITAKPVDENSDFSISTPSGSQSSISSIVNEDQNILETLSGEEDSKPDEDMLRDYQNTMSIALGETYSDSEKSSLSLKDSDIKETSEKHEDSISSTERNSLYNTPEVSMDKSSEEKKFEYSRPLPVPRSSATQDKSTKPFTKVPIPTTSSPPPVIQADTSRDSSGSELFLSPVGSLSKSPISSSNICESHTTPTSSKQETHSNNHKRPLPLPSLSSLGSGRPSNISQNNSQPKKINDKISEPTKINDKITEPTKVNDSTNKTQRKLPDLPKLKMPDKSSKKVPVVNGIEGPKLSLSPKRSKALPTQTSSKPISRKIPVAPVTFSPELKRPPRPLPVPAPSSSRVSTPDTPVSIGSKVYSTPISPPVFRPPGKIKVPLDKQKLRKGSSSDKSFESRQEKTNSENIPFADDSEMEEKFYTPCAKVHSQKPNFSHDLNENSSRKRILPDTPGTDTKYLDKTQLRELCLVDREKAKQAARERARLKSDEELGLSSPSSSTPEREVPPLQKHNLAFIDKENSEVFSESDDKLSSQQTPTSSAAETERNSITNSTTDKKKKTKSNKKHKEKKKETDSDKKEKRKSLLALILPNKDKNKLNESLNSDSTPRGSDDNLLVNGKSGKKAKKSKNKKKVDNFASSESLDKTPTQEGKKDLAICSVFSSEASNRSGKSASEKRIITLAPKASVDDFSDSDESHLSFNTLPRRMNEDLDERVARRLKRIQQKQQKQAEQKRLRMAQEIQRQLEEVEVQQRQLEEKGVAVEKALRGDGPEGENVDEGQLMSEWFTLVHEKNALLRYESQLNVRAKELELEDRQARLESNFRDRVKSTDKSRQSLIVPKRPLRSDQELKAESSLLDELLDVVEQRNSLVAMLEEDRLREEKEDRELEDIMVEKGFTLSPLSYDTRRQKVEAPLAPVAL